MSMGAGGGIVDRGLKGFFANFVEVWFLHASFGCCAVGYQQGAVMTFQVASKQVNPGGDDGRKVLE